MIATFTGQDTSGKLPKGWEWKSLEYLAEDTNRRNPKQKAPNQHFQYIDISSINNQTGQITNTQTLLGEQAPSRARKVVQANDIIIATTRPYLRNIAIVPDSLDQAISSTGFCVLRVKQEIALPKYVYYFCRSDFFTNQLIPKQRGANYPAVTDSDVFEAAIPVPHINDSTKSLNVQRQIVARIEALLAEVRSSRELLDEMRRDAERIMTVVLEKVFSDLEETNIEPKLLDTLLLRKPQYGLSDKASESAIGTPILRMGNITTDGKLSLDNLKYVELSAEDEEKYLINQGDILFNRTNSAELVGKSAVFQEDIKAVFASYLIRVVLDPNKANSKFITAYINSPRGRAYIQSQLTRAIGQVNVNAQKLAGMPILVPSVHAQERIVAHIEVVQHEVDEILETLDQDVKTLDLLEQSILERAFRGEL